MSKVAIESGLLAALVAGFILGVQHDTALQAKLADKDSTISADQSQIASLTDQLATTSHTLGDVQAKLADAQKDLPGEPDPVLMAQINTLLGTPDTTGAGTSPIASTPPPDTSAGAPASDASDKAPADSTDATGGDPKAVDAPKDGDTSAT